MANENLLFLAASVLLLVIAHGARAARWAFLFPRSYLAGRRALLVGLGLGYAVNTLVPLRMGELIRGAVATRLTQVRFSYVMATIVAERLADLVVVALLVGATAGMAADPASSLSIASLFLGAALVLIALSLVIRSSRQARRLAWKAAGIFNDRIRLAITDFLWSVSEVILGGSLLRWRFIVSTVAMWALYMAAYATFGRFLGAPLGDVLAAVVQQPLASLAVSMRQAGTFVDQISLYMFALAPVLIILAYGLVIRNQLLARTANLILRPGRSGRGALSAQRERFSAASGYENFLTALFSGDDRVISEFGMEAIDDCIVHKFYQGGSDALTALVEADHRLIIRKFAAGDAAAKLKVQAEWLQRHRSDNLPLVDVIGVREGKGGYSYDMPLVTPANDFYDVIHSSSTDRNRQRLVDVLDRVDDLHRSSAAGEAGESLVSKYIVDKVSNNASKILDFAHRMIGRPDYTINDVAYDLSEWSCLSDPVWVGEQMIERRVATIHGDLTVENIIVAPDHPLGLYIIDPNPENLFDTPLIDWAKMMQSLHLGYETLNRGISCSIADGAIQLAAVRSQAYAELHATLEDEITRRFGEASLREVYFHELINYLRLTPYKIRQSPVRGLGFFACTSVLLRRYRERAR